MNIDDWASKQLADGSDMLDPTEAVVYNVSGRCRRVGTMAAAVVKLVNRMLDDASAHVDMAAKGFVKYYVSERNDCVTQRVAFDAAGVPRTTFEPCPEMVSETLRGYCQTALLVARRLQINRRDLVGEQDFELYFDKVWSMTKTTNHVDTLLKNLETLDIDDEAAIEAQVKFVMSVMLYVLRCVIIIEHGGKL